MTYPASLFLPAHQKLRFPRLSRTKSTQWINPRRPIDNGAKKGDNEAYLLERYFMT